MGSDKGSKYCGLSPAAMEVSPEGISGSRLTKVYRVPGGMTGGVRVWRSRLIEFEDSDSENGGEERGDRLLGGRVSRMVIVW